MSKFAYRTGLITVQFIKVYLLLNHAFVYVFHSIDINEQLPDIVLVHLETFNLYLARMPSTIMVTSDCFHLVEN